MKVRLLPEIMKIIHTKVEIGGSIRKSPIMKFDILLLVIIMSFISQYSKANEIPLLQEDIMLTEALNRLSQKYEVFFSYDETSIGAVEVTYQPEKYNNVEHALDQLLEGTALKYKVFDNRYIILYEESQEAISSLKGMVRHLESVIDSQEKTVQVREKVKPLTLLHRSIHRTIEPLTFNVSGTVKDQDGEPLIGVNIQVKGTNLGTATDYEGHFSLEDIDKNAVLIFSYLGYETQEVVVTERSNLEIVMKSDSQLLDEVVVVGYGVEKEKNLTGSVTVIRSNILENQLLTNSAQALQGAKGLYVQQKSGAPGAEDIKLHIRGIGTLNNTNPLVLINGIEGSLSDLNPSDIDNISILKDASSTAIYGSRASNGVVLITTKTGKEGKAVIEYNYDFGLQQATSLPDLVTNSVDYMNARNLAAKNEGVIEPYSSDQVEAFRNNPDPYMNPNSDWIGHIYRTAPVHNHNINVSGGSSKIDYRTSLGYLDQEGIMIGSNNAKKYLFRTNVNYKMTDRLKVGADLSFIYRQNEEPSNTTKTTINYSFKALPIQPITLEDGRYAVSWVRTPHAVSPINAAAILTDDGFIKNDNYNTRLNFYVNYILPADIEFNLQYGAEKGQGLSDRFIPLTFLYNPKEPETALIEKYGPADRSSIFSGKDNLNTTINATLNWNRDIGNNALKFLGGFSSLTYESRSYNATSRDFLGNGLQVLSAGSTPFATGGAINESRLLSFFGRGNYNYKEKYLLEVNIRYDGSSKFAEGNRWGVFPSYSLGWRLDQEPFLNDVNFISELKIRGSIGKVGNNAISDFEYLSKIRIAGITAFNDNIVSTAAIDNFNDPNITWETTTKRNVGFDAKLWDYKFNVHIDYFDDKTEDILTRVSIPEQVGDLGGPLRNFYSMSNKGVEIGMGYEQKIKDIQLSLGGQFTFVDNKVTFLDGNTQISTNDYGDLSVIKEGYPVNSFFLYKVEGIFQSQEEVENHAYQDPNTAPGDIKYADINNDGVINSEDRILTGRSSIPKITYGFDVGLSYKSISVNAIFQGVNGINAYPIQNVSLPLYNGAGITKYHLEQSWTEDNRDAKFPRLMEPKHGSRINFRNNTLWLQDASYLRLKNLRISYTLPYTTKAFQNATLYLSGQNLLTFTNFPDYSDPENVADEKDLYVYPILKTYNIGVNVKF